MFLLLPEDRRWHPTEKQKKAFSKGEKIVIEIPVDLRGIKHLFCGKAMFDLCKCLPKKPSITKELDIFESDTEFSLCLKEEYFSSLV